MKIITKRNANTDGGSQPGPSGLQTNQNNSTKAPKSNSHANANSSSNANADNNDNDEAGPSNRQHPANALNENRQRLIIVQHRRSPNNDENGNMNR